MEKENLRKALTLLLIVSFLHTFIFVVLPIYLSGIGLTGYEIGMLLSIYAVATFFVSFPTGFVNDKWTVRFTMIVGVLLISVFLIGLGSFRNFLFFIPFYFLGGLGSNLVEVSIRNVVYKEKTPDKDGSKFGSYHMYRISGAAIGVLVGSVVVFLLDFSLALIVLGILYLAVIPFISFKIPTSSRIKLREYKRDILNLQVILLGIIIFLYATHWGAETTSYGLFLKNNLSLDMLMIGLYNMGAVIFLGLTAFIFGKRIDSRKNNLLKVMFLGMIISGVFHILHTYPVLPVSFIFRIIHEVGDGMVLVGIFFWISRLFGSERIGGNSSFMFAITILGQITGSLVYGPLGFHMGYHIPLIISGATTIICGFLLLLFVKMFNVKVSHGSQSLQPFFQHFPSASQ